MTSRGMPHKEKTLRKKGPAKKAERRRSQKRLADKPDASSGSGAEETKWIAPSPQASAHLSFFITKAQKVQLREKGYSEAQIAQMKPVEAHKILGLS